MRLFDELNIETQASCNRVCPTCLRQSYPDKSGLAGRADQRRMSKSLVYALINQAVELNFHGRLCLQHFNEPLQDYRIREFAAYARGKGFQEVYINTNGDYLTQERARELDGVLDRLHIALYSGAKAARETQYRAWFKHTALTFTQGEHVVTHFSPFTNLQTQINAVQQEPCERESQMRCIISYTGAMLLCCEDIAGLWNLGNAYQTSLRDLWFGEPHATIIQTLSQVGGRQAYDYCRICPRTNTPYWSELAA